ncbi:MAG: hypothetical protein RLY93_10950 [Sumerlaeia bacterium]
MTAHPDLPLSRLTASGIAAYEDFLRLRIENPEEIAPSHLLDSAEHSEVIGPSVGITIREFDTRRELGEYLFERLARIDQPELDRGLWAWLSLFYFDQLARQARTIGQSYRWIPKSSGGYGWLSFHHFMLGPYQVVRQYQGRLDDVMILLYGPIGGVPGLTTMITKNIEFATNPDILKVATLLYLTSRNGRWSAKPKSGSISQPGSMKAFVTYLRQIDLTWDLSLIGEDQLLSMLPPAFTRWKPSHRQMELGIS